MLVDDETGVVYVPFSGEVIRELGEWSRPCQLKFEDGKLIVREMAQPVKGVYITRDDLSVAQEVAA